MVGREAETAQLNGLWERAGTGVAGVVLVVGEAGIGKTRLTTELRASPPGPAPGWPSAAATSRSARCSSNPWSTPSGPPWRGSHPTSSAPRPAPTPASSADSSPTSPRRSASRTPTRRRPTPDAPSRRSAPCCAPSPLTGRCCWSSTTCTTRGWPRRSCCTTWRCGPATPACSSWRRCASRRARRSSRPSTAGASRLDLGPLPAADVAELAGRAGYADRDAAIQRRTRGNPFFVVEVLRGLTAGDHDIPESLQAAVVARVRRLGEAVEELLRAGSVLGAAVDPAVVAHLLGVDPAEAARRCEQAAAARLLVEAGPAYEFANDLIHEILYVTTPAPTRRLHHRRAADLLTATPEAVGVHALAVEDWPRAARAFLLAGRAATRRGGVVDAETLLGQALGAARRAGSAELIGRVLLARARALEGLERFTAAWADLDAADEAARQAGDRRLQMAALRELGGDVPIALGRPITESTDRLRQGLHVALDCGDPCSEADFRARLAVLATHRLAFGEALDEGARAVLAGRAAARRGDPRRGARRTQDGARLPRARRRARRGHRGDGAPRPAAGRPLVPAVGDLRGLLRRDRGGTLGRGPRAHRRGRRDERAQWLSRPRDVVRRPPRLGRPAAGRPRRGPGARAARGRARPVEPPTRGGRPPRGRCSRPPCSRPGRCPRPVPWRTTPSPPPGPTPSPRAACGAWPRWPRRRRGSPPTVPPRRVCARPTGCSPTSPRRPARPGSSARTPISAWPGRGARSAGTTGRTRS